jgi:dolichol-phosphate mannosyltransferase
MVVASRNIPGGGVSEQWSHSRRIISKLCCWMVGPLTTLKDPMSGFFAISSDYYQHVRNRVRPISYKIGLELAVKGELKQITEIPYTFEERIAGRSKVNSSVVLGMIYHFLQLYSWRLFHSKANANPDLHSL